MITLKTRQNGLYGKTAMSQLESKGLANVVGDKVYYWNEDANVFVYCSNTLFWHNAVISVLRNLGECTEEDDDITNQWHNQVINLLDSL